MWENDPIRLPQMVIPVKGNFNFVLSKEKLLAIFIFILTGGKCSLNSEINMIKLLKFEFLTYRIVVFASD